PLGLPPAAAIGIIVLGCLPTTIGSCVAVTGQSDGNEAITLINSVLSNLIGVVLTPLLILLCIGREGTTPVMDVIQLLIVIAVLPAVLGQILRLRWAAALDANKFRISITSGCLLLVVVLTIFSDIAHRGLGSGITPVAIAVCMLHLLLWLSIWLIAPLASRERGDRVAMMITANQKTAALGIPLIGTMFAADPMLSLMTLPIALYHVLQMLTGALLTGVFRAWVAKAAPLPPPPAR
ncbi:MAG: bile acid:sodium symporter, partial [Planctomycetota bacterium]